MSGGKIALSVTQVLREEIIVGSLNKGMRIIQSEWADKLQVSRMPIREAIQKLEKDGLVKIIPNKGAFVVGIDLDEVTALFNTRLHLEGQLAALALPLMISQDIEQIEQMYKRMTNATEHTIYNKLHKQFHRKIYERSPWKHTLEVIDQLAITSMAANDISEFQEIINEEHRLIVEAIKMSDARKLKEALEYHIYMTRKRFLKYISTRKNSST